MIKKILFLNELKAFPSINFSYNRNLTNFWQIQAESFLKNECKTYTDNNKKLLTSYTHVVPTIYLLIIHILFAHHKKEREREKQLLFNEFALEHFFFGDICSHSTLTYHHHNANNNLPAKLPCGDFENK